MSNTKYIALPGMGNPAKLPVQPEDARVTSVWLDKNVVKNCIFAEAAWFKKPFQETGLYKHASDELLVFFGSDPDDHENLNAEIEIWLENDKIVLTQTSVVFVPAGVAHGNMMVKNVTKPVIHFTCHMNSSAYEAIPAAATAPPGSFAKNWVEKYEPVNGFLPEAPEGFLTRLLWIDDAKLKGAPYYEAVWFHTTNDTGPQTHTHDFDELIGFLGSDPDHPEELGAEITFYLDGETVTLTKSCVIYIPRGVSHSPILVPKLERSIIHFSGGNGGNYAMKD
jgi:mannose-6-phosphate isomerase-like protein (cupin superfamily)